MVNRKHILWGIAFLIVLGGLLIVFVMRSQRLNNQQENNLLVTQTLEKTFSFLRGNNISYFRDDQCRNFIFMDSWFAEPHNRDCGSGDKYLPFTDLGTDLFEQVRDSLDIDDMRFSEARIEYDSNSMIRYAEFFLNKPSSGVVGFMYEPARVLRSDQIESEHQQLNDKWYVIYYDPNPF